MLDLHMIEFFLIFSLIVIWGLCSIIVWCAEKQERDFARAFGWGYSPRQLIVSVIFAPVIVVFWIVDVIWVTLFGQVD
jgi:hypothetical protein